MRNHIGVGAVLAVSIVLSGCATELRLEEILYEIFPQSAQVELDSTCFRFLGPAVGIFTVSSLPSEKSMLDHMADGHWVRSESLLQFAEADYQEYAGSGVGATILDGKKCLRDSSGQAEDILWGNKPGLFFRSNNRKIVAILFDEPKGHGVLFIQAP